MSTTIPSNASGPIPGAMRGRTLIAAAAMAGPVLTIRCVRSTAMNKTVAATPAVVPISTKEWPESKPGRADPSAPACASVQLSPPIAQMTRRFPRATTKNARPTMAPATQTSACLLLRVQPRRHGKEERNREDDLGGLQVVEGVLPVRDDAVREHDLKGEHE